MSSDLLDRHLGGLAIYNPDLLGKDELVAQFVARRALLDCLLQYLRDPGFAQHQIVVGSRGMGKTTLLRRLRFAVEDDTELTKTWLPVTFPEEQYNIGRLSDLYLNILDAVSDALESRGRRDEAEALDTARDALPKRNEEQRAGAALSLLIETANRIDRRLLLLIDNLDLIFRRLEKQVSAQWSLREMLSLEHRILLIGAMPVIAGVTYRYDAPFYDFFQIHELRALSHEETRDVLATLARELNAPQVAELLESDPARIRTLHTLAGGNPRTIALLFTVLAHGPGGDVRTDLEKLLDHATPLYKARFEALPPQAQQVVDAVAIHWNPISAGELAEKMTLEVNLVSAQLNRLVQQGVLEKVEYYPATRAGFQIAERFFNIWYLMRASRRVRRRLLWFVEFLRLFWGAEEMRRKIEELLQTSTIGTSKERLRYAELCLALAQIAEADVATRDALETRAVRTLVSDEQLNAKLREIFDLDGADAELRPLIDRSRWTEVLSRAIERSKFSESNRQQMLKSLRELGDLAGREEDFFLPFLAHFLVFFGEGEIALEIARSRPTLDGLRLAEAYALGGLGRDQEAIRVLRALAMSQSTPLSMRLSAISALFSFGILDDAFVLLRGALSAATELSQTEVLQISSGVPAVIQSGGAGRLRQLIEELRLEETLRVPYEALKVAESGSADSISKLAPEIQEPVRHLLGRVDAPTGATNPKRKQARRRRA